MMVPDPAWAWRPYSSEQGSEARPWPGQADRGKKRGQGQYMDVARTISELRSELEQIQLAIVS
jgi:hypothetical protein